MIEARKQRARRLRGFESRSFAIFCRRRLFAIVMAAMSDGRAVAVIIAALSVQSEETKKRAKMLRIV